MATENLAEKYLAEAILSQMRDAPDYPPDQWRIEVNYVGLISWRLVGDVYDSPDAAAEYLRSNGLKIHGARLRQDGTEIITHIWIPKDGVFVAVEH